MGLLWKILPQVSDVALLYKGLIAAKADEK
jgi:hypothetical protein